MPVGFLPVDDLMQQVDVAKLIEFYSVEPSPVLLQKRNETRSKCFLNCGKGAETSGRALAIQADHPAKQWKCWEKGCGKSGNLVSMCDLLKDGQNAGGRPRGQRFKEIARDLQEMANSEDVNPETVAAAQATVHDDCHAILLCNSCVKANPMDAKFCYDCGDSLPEAPAKQSRKEAATTPRRNVIVQHQIVNEPLAESKNDKARELVNLDEKFLMPSQVCDMPPSASVYLRKRAWLTDELARKFRMGYLPRDAGGDKSGGTMRGKIVYEFRSDDGEILTWFGRDPDFETKLAQGSGNAGPVQKFRFVKGFQRGLELFGQEQLHSDAEYARERLAGMGLPVVAGPNDVMRLHALGVPAVALCSEDYQITREQAEKLARLLRELKIETALIMPPLSSKGEQGLRQCLGYLCQVTAVRAGWTGKMFAGKYRDREVESLTGEEWEEIEAYLRSGRREGWSLA